MWRDFRADEVRASLVSVAQHGFVTVRVPLAWDAFMPSYRRPHPGRMRDLEAVLRIAAELALRVVPVLFVQSFGDCVLLPAYAVDRAAARPGVRVVSDGRVEPGGPRDVYTDPLMLEMEVAWVDALLRGFAGHPAIAAWDLGHDPAATVRPRRIADLAAWVELLAGRVRAQDERVELTLGAGDVVEARGVRLAAVAPHLDGVGVVLGAERASLGDGAAAFVAQLALRLLGGSAAITPHLCARDDAADAPRRAGENLEALHAAGCAGAGTQWADAGGAVAELPPFDRAPELAAAGITDSSGDPKPELAEWSAWSRSERSRERPHAWPATIDVDAYYANLPESALDLHAAWQRERGRDPAILDTGSA